MIIIADTWKVTPLVVLLTLAGLQTIPHTLFEAANIDGAGPFRRLFHIYLPLLRPIILVILVIRTMELFRVFDIIYIMMTWQINVLSIYTYQLAFNFSQFGKGSAIGFLVEIIIGALAIVYMRFLYTEEVEQ